MNTASKIRAALRENPEGLTDQELVPLIGFTGKLRCIRETVRGMPDAYIYDWVYAGTDSKGRAVYAPLCRVVVPPENCPHPRKQQTHGTSGPNTADEPRRSAASDSI